MQEETPNGWRVRQFSDGSNRGVMVQVPDLKRYKLTHEEAQALIDAIEKRQDS